MQQEIPKGTESMPRSELHFASGLCFTHVFKAGVGISVESGRGFVIAKHSTEKPDGTRSWTWSAPCFINVHAGGIGVTLGYSEIDSLIILVGVIFFFLTTWRLSYIIFNRLFSLQDSPEAVSAFTKTNVELDTDITGAAGSQAATHLPATAANLSDYKLTDKTFTYSITKGVMVDVSLTGMGYTVDSDKNAAMFGEFVSPQAILDGGVQAPEEMKTLYETLDRVLNEFYAAEGSKVAATSLDELKASNAEAAA